MENQINTGDYNDQQIGQSDGDQPNSIQPKDKGVQVGNQTISQQKNLPNIFKLSTKSLWIVLGCLFIVLIAVIGVFWNKQRYTNQPQSLTPTKQAPSPTIAAFPIKLEWSTYKDEGVEYKYPKGWTQSNEVPEKFQSLIKFSSSCKGLVFQNPNNQDIVLVVENYPQPLQQYLPSCWTQGTLSGSTPNSRQIRIGEKNDKIDIMQLSFGPSKYTLQRHGFESNFTTINAYQLSIIFPKDFTSEVEPIFDEIISSFRYLKQYQVNEPKEWKTYASKFGFSFEYPTEWGEVKEEITDFGNDPNKAESGKSYSLSFSLKSNVGFQWVAYGAGRSADYSAGRGSIFTDYRGDPNKPPSVVSEITMGLTYSCYQYPVQYYPYRGVIRLNLPGKEINGVMIVVPILSVADMEKYDKIVSDFINQEESCKNQGGTESPTVTAKEKEIVGMLDKGVNFDQESQINLKIFDRISKSTKIF